MKNTQKNKNNNLSLSTWSYLSYAPMEALDKIHSVGFRAVELWGDYPHFWPRQYLQKNNLKKLKNKLKIFTGPNSIHAPIVSIVDKNIGIREEAFSQIKETILLASKLNIKRVNMHGGKKFAGMQGWNYEKEAFETLIKYLKNLAAFAAKNGVFLLFENVPGEFGFRADEMKKIIKRVNSKNLFMTFDTGHANMIGPDGVREFFNLLKNKIKAVHFNDNTGTSDIHLPVGYGNIKFCEFMNKNKKTLQNATCVGEFAFNKKNPDFAAKSYLNFMKNFI